MSHYFINDSSLKTEEQEIRVSFKEKNYKFLTDNGVFSKKGLDFGTRFLLETIDIDNLSGSVLDLGCGYGPIGIILGQNKNIDIDMVDINERSINLTKKNLKLNNVKANVFYSNGYDKIIKKYDYIITNPPIRIGKKKMYDLLFNAANYLNDQGRLILVINKSQGAKSVTKDLKEKYTLEKVEKNKGFYVIYLLK